MSPGERPAVRCQEGAPFCVKHMILPPRDGPPPSLPPLTDYATYRRNLLRQAEFRPCPPNTPTSPSNPPRRRTARPSPPPNRPHIPNWRPQLLQLGGRSATPSKNHPLIGDVGASSIPVFYLLCASKSLYETIHRNNNFAASLVLGDSRDGVIEGKVGPYSAYCRILFCQQRARASAAQSQSV